MRRYLVLAAAVVMQLCLGGMYAWSAFVAPLREGYGLTTAETQLIFGVGIAVFTVAMVFAGRLQESHGPRRTALIGGLFFGGGYLVASLSEGSFGLLLLGIGLIGGIGVGFCYVCPLATSVRWFPLQKGLVTGLAVAGFGAGAILLSSLAEALLGAGLTVLEVFRVVGVSYGAVVVVASLSLAVPGRTLADRPAATVAVRSLLSGRAFWVLALGMFTGTFAGLLVIGNLKPLGLSAGVSTAAALVAITAFAVGNASGRILWGALADRLGRPAIPLSLLFLAAAVLALLPAGASDELFVVASALAGFGFGACFVLYAAEVASLYGVGLVGRVYPWVFLFYGLSGTLGPSVGGWLYDVTGSYLPATLVAAAVALGGALGCWRLSRDTGRAPVRPPLRRPTAAAPGRGGAASPRFRYRGPTP